MKKFNLTFLGCLIALTINVHQLFAKDSVTIKQDIAAKTVYLSDGSGKLSLRVNYSDGCRIDQLNVNGKNTLAPSGTFSAIKPDTRVFTSRTSGNHPTLKITGDRVTLSNITYGDSSFHVTEEWSLTPRTNGILWEIKRQYSQSRIIDDMAIPVWNFANLKVWEGGILNNGGMIWCKYLKDRLDVLGMHTDGVTFWHQKSFEGLRITATGSAGKYIASKFFHGSEDEFSFAQYLTNQSLEPRHKLNRFYKGSPDIYAPFEVKKESVTMKVMISYINYDKEYPMGKLPGIDAAAVRELRNTTARYGVVDQNIIGGNGWTTNWECLHAPFFAQIGLFVNDENYTRIFSATLDQERDLSMTKEGRVLSRWHNEPEDEILGTYNFKT